MRRRCTTEQYNSWKRTYRDAIGAAYRPFIRVNDFGSSGTCVRKRSVLFRRLYHYLSRNESFVGTVAEWGPEVVDLREQYALDPDTTQQIASEIGVPHPRDTRSREIWVMTTDILVTKEVQGLRFLVPIGVKDRCRQARPRELEKAEIQSRYWKLHSAEFQLREADPSTMITARNIDWLRAYDSIQARRWVQSATAAHLADLARLLMAGALQLGQACSLADRDHGLPDGTSMLATRVLLASRTWSADLTHLIHPSARLRCFATQGPAAHV